ncbi:MAG: AAA family ATPase [Ktedonobacteraceae bacterium]|nr:AAA family ATPase [Ktedonobacteraceae bacterium]
MGQPYGFLETTHLCQCVQLVERLGSDIIQSEEVEHVGKAYLLTGEPKVGKTTTLKKIIDGIGVERCGGFYMEEVRTQGERTGFRLRTLNGEDGMMADVNSDSPLRVGKFGVMLYSVESIGLAAISTAIAAKDFVILDEIGPMQLYSARFKQAVLHVLTSARPLVGTIVFRPYPWADELKQRRDVTLFELTPGNRDITVTRLANILKAL